MSDESSGAGTWLLLALALVAVAALGSFLYLRSRRRSEWAAWFASLESETRTAVQLQLPQVLAHRDAAVRVVAWTPLRASLLALQPHWQTVADGAPDEATKLRGP